MLKDASEQKITPQLVNIQEEEIIAQEISNQVPECKSVHLVEIEELAIQQLKDYYQTLYGDGNVRINVLRENSHLPLNRSPRWKRLSFNSGIT